MVRGHGSLRGTVSVPVRKFAGILRLRTPMRASGGPARRRHASQMRSSWFHPNLATPRSRLRGDPDLRLDARTGSLRLPATICSPNLRDGTLVMTTLRTGNYIDGDWRA